MYGESHVDMKYKTWELMKCLREQDAENLPWLCAGDFNEILFQHEKEGGKLRPQACLDHFKNALEVCELDDLGFSGDIFTWRNKQTKGSEHIWERLDRAVVNGGWRMLFPLMSVKNAEPFHSDHRPVIVVTESVQRPNGGGDGFNFEASWIKEEGCRKVIEDAWGLSSEVERSMSVNLRSVNVLGDLEKRLKKAKEELEKWRREPISYFSVDKEAVWIFKVDRLEEQIYLYWRQRAHANWLRFGDRNTTFFHNACTTRRRRNRKTSKGEWGVGL